MRCSRQAGRRETNQAPHYGSINRDSQLVRGRPGRLPGQRTRLEFNLQVVFGSEQAEALTPTFCAAYQKTLARSLPNQGRLRYRATMKRLVALRDAAMDRFAALGLPTSKAPSMSHRVEYDPVTRKAVRRLDGCGPVNSSRDRR